MSEWESKVWFEYSDIIGTIKSGSDTGGSGSTPPIELVNDYSICSEQGVFLMLESGSEILVES